MPHTYEGIDEQTDSVTHPSDGDGPHIKAADVNPALEDAANNNTWNKRRHQLGTPLNFRVGTLNFNLQRGIWSKQEQTWYAVGDDPGTDQFERSQDYGRTWVDLSAALGGAALNVTDIAIDDAGNLMIVSLGSRRVLNGTLTTYGSLSGGAAWTNTNNVLTAGLSSLRIVFDATSGNWVVVGRNGSSGFVADAFASPVPATPGTLPAAWTSYTGTTQNAELASAVVPAGGLVVACFINDAGGGNTVHVARSTNGGTVWAAASFTTTMTSPTIISRPTYNSLRDEWYILVSKAGEAECWRSTNGAATWTKVGEFTTTDNKAACGLAWSDDRLVATTRDGKILYSWDRGETFKFRLRLPQSDATLAIRDGGGGFMFWNNIDEDSHASNPIGDTGEEL
jgi:hypothetical protein